VFAAVEEDEKYTRKWSRRRKRRRKRIRMRRSWVGRGDNEVHSARAGAWKDCGSGAQLTFRPLVSVRTAKIASVRRGAHGRVHGRQGRTCNIPPPTLHD